MKFLIPLFLAVAAFSQPLVLVNGPGPNVTGTMYITRVNADTTNTVIMTQRITAGSFSPVSLRSNTGLLVGSYYKVVYNNTLNATVVTENWTIPVSPLTTTRAAVFSATVGGVGTVSSVGLTTPAEFLVSGSPVTSTGNLAFSWVSNTQNKFLATPSSASGIPVLRLITLADLPAGITASFANAFSAAPAICPVGQAPRGISADGSATGCFIPSGGNGNTFVTELTSSSLVTINGSASSTNRICWNVGTLVSCFTVPSTLSMTGSGTGDIYVYLDKISKGIVAGHAISGVTLSGTNLVTINSGVSGFPITGLPIAVVSVVGSSFNTVSQMSPSVGAGKNVQVDGLKLTETSDSIAISPYQRTLYTLNAPVSGCTADTTDGSVLASYTIPSSIGFAPGDTLRISVVFRRVGSTSGSFPWGDVKIAGNWISDTGNFGARIIVSADAYLVLDASANYATSSLRVYRYVATRSNSISIQQAGSPVFSGDLTSTPLIEFRHGACTAPDTISLVQAQIVWIKGVTE